MLTEALKILNKLETLLSTESENVLWKTSCGPYFIALLQNFLVKFDLTKCNHYHVMHYSAK